MQPTIPIRRRWVLDRILMGSERGRRRTVVAIDGPAGAGKSTVAGIVAERMGLAHIDTGATYRVVARVAVERGIPLTESAKIAEVAEEVSEHLSVDDQGRLQFDGQGVGDEIRTADVSRAASVIAAYPDVRRVLVRIQRSLVPARGAVVEGRDIGTVVWPNADLKVYLEASEEVRVARRAADPGAAGGVEAVRERDARDANRPVGAMRPAPDALVFDTTDRAAEVVAQLVLEHLRPPEPPGAFYVVVRGLLAGLLRGPFRLEVRGTENIPSRGAAIIAPNHRSLIDIPVAGVITKRKIWFMAKEELFASKQAAAFFRKMGAFPVRRGKPDRHALQRSLELLSEGELVGLFPEGTRRPMSRFEEVEEGLAYVALKSGAPVVPVAISGTEEVFPKDRKLPRFVKIRVLIGEPLRLGGPVTGMLPRSRVREATAIATRRLQSVMDEIEPAGEKPSVMNAVPNESEERTDVVEDLHVGGEAGSLEWDDADVAGTLPIVAVVGRPNVGKSTLVNRILGRREAIVQELPGVTRDRILHEAEWRGRRFLLVDTGGLEVAPEGELAQKVAETARVAASEADVVAFVVDVTDGITAEDRKVADVLRRLGRRVVVVANKADNTDREGLAVDFYELGFGEPQPVSALHGRSSGDLLDVLTEGFGVAEAVVTAEPNVAIVGRPNVGKSSLFNRIVGSERSIVHDEPGTTRDAVDTVVEVEGVRYRFVDTAGMRRERKVDDQTEFYGSVRTMRALDRSDVALVVIDGEEGIARQDMRIAEQVADLGRSAILVLNKIDLLLPEDVRIEEEEVRRRLPYLNYAPLVRTSAEYGAGVDKIFPALRRVLEARGTRVPTHLLNAVIDDLQARTPIPSRGKGARIKYAVQAESAPPLIVLFGSGRIPEQWLRYLDRSLRKRFGFEGAPIRFAFRGPAPRRGVGAQRRTPRERRR